MIRLLGAWIVGLGLMANGLTMLTVPEAWSALVPGVPRTGPFNPHFAWPRLTPSTAPKDPAVPCRHHP